MERADVRPDLFQPFCCDSQLPHVRSILRDEGSFVCTCVCACAEWQKNMVIQGIFLWLAGPYLASMITPNLMEQASIWCFFSIAQIGIMVRSSLRYFAKSCVFFSCSSFASNCCSPGAATRRRSRPRCTASTSTPKLMLRRLLLTRRRSKLDESKINNFPHKNKTAESQYAS